MHESFPASISKIILESVTLSLLRFIYDRIEV